MPDEVFRTAVHRLLGLLPPCLVGVPQWSALSDTMILRSWPPTCSVAPTGGDLLRDGMQGVFSEAGFKVAVENSSIMPIQLGADGQPHTRRADLVAIPPGGGPRIIADVVTTDCIDSANPTRSATFAGHAVGQAARGKERKYADHPVGDEFAALAMDVHGAFGSRWLDLIQRLARQAIDRQPVFCSANRLAWARQAL
eukprot:SM000299S10851  [mRNA]  locus=s299:68617:69452:- [translate_table: standard]